MTPPTALIVAARRAATKRAADQSPDAGHPRRLRPTSAPTAPRRISGPVARAVTPRATEQTARSVTPRAQEPASERTAASARSAPKQTKDSRASGRAATPPRRTAPRRPAAPRPRRVSFTPPQRRSRPTDLTLGQRATAFLRSLPDHMVIDRLVRGRAWIPALGIMLAGIVAMQVEVLKLNAGIGRSMQRTTELTARNQLLRATVAQLGDDQRIESLAARMGMIMPAPPAVGFLSAPANGVEKAVSNIHVPNADQFLGAASTNGTVAVGPPNSASGSTGSGGGGASAATSTPSPATSSPSPATSSPSPATSSPGAATSGPATSATAPVGSAASTGTTAAASPIGTGTQGGANSGR